MKKITGKLFKVTALLFLASLMFSCKTMSEIADGFKMASDLGMVDSKVSNIVQTADDITRDYSSFDKYEVGRSVSAVILSQYLIYNEEPALTAYLNKICQAIIENSYVENTYMGYRVIILDSETPNALSTPAGHIFISRGLLKCADSEDALAAIIAHEIAHIQLEHGINSIRTAKGVETGLNLLSEIGKKKFSKSNLAMLGVDQKVYDKFSNNVSTIAENLINSGFSQEQEFEADKTALYLMTDAGYDPTAMIEMLRNIPKEKKSKKSSGWTKTHPTPKDRIKHSEEAMDLVGIYVAFKNPIKAKKGVRQPRYEENMSCLFDVSIYDGIK